jgi:adenylylsulfate kinase
VIIEYLRPVHHHRGATIWLTGLSGAGKSAIAQGRRVVVLDGDEVRPRLSPDLGFSMVDRDANVRRIGFVARLLASNGVLSIVAVIAPYESSRAAVRAEHAAHGATYLEVHVAAPVNVCAARDTKGLYARQAAGELSGLTGVDDPYEPPGEPHLRLDTDRLTVDRSVARLYALLIDEDLIFEL